MIIAHNIMADFASRRLNINTNSKSKSAERLASGYRINRAADDAAGLAISEKMRTQIRGLAKGEKNTQDGISLCQVAEGALAEVCEILNRITELSVQAANDTNTEEDRQCIQKEINQLLAVVDDIGKNTEFNTIPVFQGYDITDGGVVIEGDIPMQDIYLADIDLGRSPFNASSNGDTLQLQAIVRNNSVANGRSYNLIYNNGSTSNSSFRITNAAGDTEVVKLENITATNYSYDGAGIWSRDFNYTANGNNITITQKVEIDRVNASNDEKNYVISYEIANNSSDETKVEFMFHADTAYNNNDVCEGYFINGTRVENYCIYSEPTSALANSSTSGSRYVYDNVPDSFSIVDVDSALAFSEKISFEGGVKPSSLSIGHYSRIDDWPYYDAVGSELGENTNRKDLGFSLYYDLTIPGNDRGDISFKYGIVATEQDENLDNVDITKNDTVIREHIERRSFWIQSGANTNNGMFLTIDEMNSDVLGIRGIDVTTWANANDALTTVQNGMKKVLANRVMIGAQQNRLEHTLLSVQNTAENLQAAESRIRDADMADEMVEYSKSNILEQAANAMLAQANHSTERVLQMLE